ncbi:MAG: hypothetical protein ACR2J6_07300 [Thermoleophilaceae bacterium]
MIRSDPRQVAGRRREARARVKILDVPGSGSAPNGSVSTMQEAEVTLPRCELNKMWTPEYLERLARTYWRFLTRVSLGLLRVLYTEEGRDIAVIGRPFVLLTFHKPEYDVEGDCGSVTWRIKKGLLVAPAGRTKGYLRLTVKRPPADGEEHPASDLVTGTVTSEVANFYPLIAGWGWFSRIGRYVYRITQLRIHIVVTHAFLRSLARLDLAPSVVGAMKNAAEGDVAGPERTPELTRPGR